MVRTAALVAALATLAAAAPAGASVKPYDFDHDGRQELVVQAPRFQPFSGGGLVVVRAGRHGLTRSAQVIKSDSSFFGYSVASGDFDGDGYADLASTSGPGEVTVLYGSARGLDRNRASVWREPDRTTEGGMAAADFDGDGYDDLAVGTVDLVEPFEPGAIAIVRGGRNGLATTTARRLPGEARTIAAGDANGDGHPDIAFAYAGETLSVCPGTADGPRTCRTLSHTGYVNDIAIGNVTGNRRREIVVAATGAEYHGAVELYRLRPGGTIAPRLAIDETTPGVPGHQRRGASFGGSIAVGRLDRDRWADMAVGNPYGPLGGSVTILHGARDGVARRGNRKLRQSSDGVPGTDERGDDFGLDVALLDHDGDGRLDLDVAAWNEDREKAPGNGRVTTLYGIDRGFTRAQSSAPDDFRGASDLPFWGLGD